MAEAPLLHIKSVRSIFLILMAALILTISLPLLFSGISLMNRLTYQLGTEILTQRLDALINPVDRNYQKLQRIGLEDSFIHRRQIREMALERFAGYTYKKSGAVYVIKKEGTTVLPRNDRSNEETEFPARKESRMVLLEKMSDREEGIVEYTKADKKRLAAYRFYEPWQSYVGLGIDKDELFAARNVFIKLNAMVLIVVVIFAILAMLTLNTIIINPLIQLAGYSRKVAAGNYNASLTGNFFLEFGDLKAAVEHMITNLRQKMAETSNQLEIISKRERERREAEKKLAAEQQRLLVTLRSIGDGVITTDTHGIITMLNYAGEEITGWKQHEAAGQSLAMIFNIVHEKTGETCVNPVDQVMETGKIVELANHTVLICRDGTRKSIADSGAPILDNEGNIIGVVLVFRDVTEKMRFQEHLRKAEKLESLGVLAGGIAHDFNNILAAVLGNLSLVLDDVESNNELVQHIDKAYRATERAKGLTHQLLTFSKGGEPVTETSSLAKIVEDSASFVLLGSNVKCTTMIPEDLWLVEIDRDQISQVIQNIVINSDQAMPQGGEITISCANMEAEACQTLALSDQKHVLIAISDNGPGISPSVLSRIFDPFFTTKEKGSGLGLAICHSIIEKHNGQLDVSSETGTGTTFNIYLPASPQAIPPSLEDEKAVEEKTGTGRVMIMDDEEMVRNLAEKILLKYGFEVVSVSDGWQALNEYHKARDENRPIDLVIMDLTIPGGMGGKETIRRLLEIDPQARALVASGYSNDPIMANYLDYGFRAVISKPYTITELVRVVRKVLRES